MTQRKKHILIITSCFLFTIIYLFLAARPVDHNLKITPVWTVSIDRTTANPTPDTTPVPFKLGQRLGYFTSDGDILLTESFPYMATISDSRWATYTPSAANTVFYTPDKEELGTVSTTGFPYFTSSNNFAFIPGGMSFAFLNDDGSEAWRHEHTSPITAFSDSPAGCVAGYADGRLTFFNPDGTAVFTTKPGGSDYEVILGAAVSDDGSGTACISGLNRQRFVLYRTVGEQTKTVFHEYLEGNLREQTFVRFSTFRNRVFANESNGLLIVDTEELVSEHIPLEGKIVDLKELPEAGLFAVLTKDGQEFSIYLFEEDNALLGSFTFDASFACISADAESLYIGRNEEITKLEISR